MCMSLAIKFAINFANNFAEKKFKKKKQTRNQKRDFLQEEDKDYCAFLLFIEDLYYCFAVALEKKKRKKRINLVIFASLISVYYIPTISYTHQYSFRICQIKFLLTVCYKS